MAVVDVFYKKWCDSNLEINAAFESDIEDFEEADNCDNKLLFLKYAKLSFLKRSPTKNDILQSYVNMELKKNLQLILDSHTRWRSLLDMLPRFLLLKVPLQKAIEELNMTAFTADDFEIIQTIILTLESTENYSSSFVQIWT